MDRAPEYNNDDSSFDDIIRFVAECAKEMHAFPKALSREDEDIRLSELRKAVKRIGRKVSRKPPPLERYALQWQQFAAGEANSLDRGTIRYLCWESNIATSPLFLAYLHYSGSRLSRRSLEGLVQSCHNKWEDDFPDSSSVAAVRTFVEAYQGSDPVLRRWRASLDAVLGPNGPHFLGRDLVLKGERLAPYLSKWYLPPQSPFVGMLVKEATAECRKRLGSGAPVTLSLLFADLLPWLYWKLRDLKEQLGHLILHAAATGEIQNRIVAFVIGHKELGDPRSEESRTNWIEVNVKAKERLTEWLQNSDDLVRFDQVYRYGKGWVWQLREGKQSSLRPNWTRYSP